MGRKIRHVSIPVLSSVNSSIFQTLFRNSNYSPIHIFPFSLNVSRSWRCDFNSLHTFWERRKLRWYFVYPQLMMVEANFWQQLFSLGSLEVLFVWRLQPKIPLPFEWMRNFSVKYIFDFFLAVSVSLVHEKGALALFVNRSVCHPYIRRKIGLCICVSFRSSSLRTSLMRSQVPWAYPKIHAVHILS